MSDDFNTRRHPIAWWEIEQLKSQGCRASDWNLVRVSDDTDLEAIINVDFRGAISIGLLDSHKGIVLENALLENCVVGDDATVRNIGVAIRNCVIGRGARVENTSLIEFENESPCGIGTEVDVLDETGSRAVKIYPGLTAQTAIMMARLPKWNAAHFSQILDTCLESLTPEHKIGNGAVVESCGRLINVSIGNEVKVIGAKSLKNGVITNNAAPGRCLAFVGADVDAENFIIDDGIADSGAVLRNTYVGQGAMLEKGFSAHDSLFFANCSLENGEGCALFAGPYTVSMHKATLLIGCQTSFMNAGSGSNQSNHMYKLGPVHWGLLERGVKTSSDSYLMLGAKIGAFSLLMGQHKTHPDSSQFPFSYLFGDDRGATVVVPGVMLRSCGLLRDEKKWPSRDRRLKRKLPMQDRIIFDVLNPMTVDKMLTASEVIEELLQRPADDDRYLRYRGMKFTRASLERAKKLYELAIFKYLDLKQAYNLFEADADLDLHPELEEDIKPKEWVDLAGLLMTRDRLESAKRCNSLAELEQIFNAAYDEYHSEERVWITQRFEARWRRPKDVIIDKAFEFDRMVSEDRARYLEDLAAQNEMLAL